MWQREAPEGRKCHAVASSAPPGLDLLVSRTTGSRPWLLTFVPSGLQDRSLALAARMHRLRSWLVRRFDIVHSVSPIIFQPCNASAGVWPLFVAPSDVPLSEPACPHAGPHRTSSGCEVPNTTAHRAGFCVTTHASRRREQIGLRTAGPSIRAVTVRERSSPTLQSRDREGGFPRLYRPRP